MTSGRREWTYLLATIATILWGTSFVALKVALRSISPGGLVAVRSVLGVLVLAVALSWRRPGTEERPARGDAWKIALLGVLGVPVHVTLQAFGLTLTSAVHSGWLIALNPVFTSILAAMVLRERFPPLKSAGIALGFSGALVVIAGGVGRAALYLPSTRGDLLILLSSLNWATYTLLARGLMTRRRPVPTTLRAMSIGGAVAVAGYAVLGDPRELAGVSAAGWASLGYLGIGCSGVGYLVWSAALERMEAGTLSTFQYVQPLVTAVAAAAWIGETVGGTTALGGALVLSGVYLVQRAAARAGASTPPPEPGASGR